MQRVNTLFRGVMVHISEERALPERTETIALSEFCVRLMRLECAVEPLLNSARDYVRRMHLSVAGHNPSTLGQVASTDWAEKASLFAMVEEPL